MSQQDSDDDFDVDAEFARELAALSDEDSNSQSTAYTPIEAERAAAAEGADANEHDYQEPDSLRALRAAFAAREQFAEQLTHTLDDIKTLEAGRQQTGEVSAYCQGVAEAVAAFTALPNEESAVDGDEADDTAAADKIPDGLPKAPEEPDNGDQYADRVKLQWIPAVATPLDPGDSSSGTHLPDPEPAVARSVQDASQRQQTITTTEGSTQDSTVMGNQPPPAAAAAVESQEASAGDNQKASAAAAASQQPQSDRSWWRKVWHGLTGKSGDKEMPQGATADAQLPAQLRSPNADFSPSLQAPLTGNAATAAAAATQHRADQRAAALHVAAPSAAEAAAGEIAAERAAAKAAHELLHAEETSLQLALQEQAAAAAAREAAMKTLRDQLHQQRVIAAQRHMAAWRIARAWQTYKHSSARDARHAQVTALQAVIRGAAARSTLRQLRQRQQVLAELQEALRKGQAAAVLAAQQRAAEAGFGDDAQQLSATAQSAQAAAAQQLQQAAATGNHAAFTAAVAAAAPYAALQADIAACTGRFESRKATTEQALAVAVKKLPLTQVQGAVDVALQLGVNAKQLAAAVESVRARDEAAVARVSAAVKAAGAAAQRCADIAMASSSSSRALGEDASPTTAANGWLGLTGSQEFDAAVADCQKYGKTVEAAAARQTLQQYRQTAAAALEAIAGQGRSSSAVQEVIKLCRSLGGLEQQIEVASSRLFQRQEALKAQLQQQLQQLQAADRAPASAAVSVATYQKELQQLLHQAEQLGVRQEVLDVVKQQLQASQDEALQAVQQAAAVGSLQQLQQALTRARQWQISEQQIQQCQQQLQQRRSEAAEKLSAAARACCAAMNPAAGREHLLLLSAAVQQLVQHAGSDYKPALSAEAKSKDLQIYDLLQQFEQQHCDCVELGLQDNAELAATAVMCACKEALQEGYSVVASVSLNLDDAACTSTEPAASSSSQSDSKLLPVEESWYCMAAPAAVEPPADADTAFTAEASSCHSRGPGTSTAMQQQRQQQQQQQQQLPDMMAATGPAGLCSAGAVARCQVPAPAPLLAPAAILQQQWAQNLVQAAAAASSITQGDCSSSSSKQVPAAASTQQFEPSVAVPVKQQEIQRLQQVLCANAAVSVSQLHELRQLDLSLEQLVGLQGLGQLCPHLQVLAVNMNKLSELAIHGCQQLQQIAAKDNMLDQWPDLTQNPQLQSLLLDNNRIKQLLIFNNSKTPLQQQHASLHTLSLANNQLNSLLITAVGAGGSNRSQPTGSSTGTGSSNSSSSSSVPVRVFGLSSYLPQLQVLRVPGNQLLDLKGLEGCRNLCQLDVSRNKLTSLQGLAGCHLLQQLQASGNALFTLPDQLHLPLLQHLDLSNNSFTTWPELPPLPHLQQLNLSDNRIAGHLPYLHGLEQLRVLDLGFNQLVDIQHVCVAGISAAKRLEELQLHDNPWQMRSSATGDRQQGQQQQQEIAEGPNLYRRYVICVMPWLTLLDRDVVHPQQAPEQQPQQQQQRDLVALGEIVSSRVDLSVRLMRQLRSDNGTSALARPLQQTSTIAPVASSSSNSIDSNTVTAEGAFTPAAAHMAAGVWLQSLALEDVRGMVAQERQQMQQSLAKHHKQLQLPTVGPCRHLQQAADPGLSSGSGTCGLLGKLEQQWCYNTRVNLVWQQAQQQQQQTIKLKGTSIGRPASGRVASEIISHVSDITAARQLAQQHLAQHTQQDCSVHQEQLIVNHWYQKQQQAKLAAAAEILQCSWRARSIRRQHKQQLQQHQQQQVLIEAATAMQSCWRARCARLLLQQQHHQQVADCTRARHAAASRIQAAVRGHRVRNRLKAALAAVAGGNRSRAAGSTYAALLPTGLTPSDRGGGGYSVLDDSTDWDEFAGVADDFVTMPASLLDELNQQHSSSSSVPAAFTAAAQGSAGSPLLKVLAAASSSSFSSASAPPAAIARVSAGPSARAAAAAANPAYADLQDSPSEYSTISVAGSSSKASAAAREAKLQKLMDEWGFTDRATAEAYYKRIKHTKQGAMKHKLQEQLKDPTARLQRLQGQLQGAPPVAASNRGSGSTKGGPAPGRSPQKQSLAILRDGGTDRSSSGSGRTSRNGDVRRDDSGAAWAVPAGTMQQQNQSHAHVDDDQMSMHSFSSYGTAGGGGRLVGEHYTAGPPAVRAAAKPAGNSSSSSRQLKSSYSASAAKQAAALPSMPAAAAVGPAGLVGSRADRSSMSSGGSSTSSGSSRQVQLPMLSAGASYASPGGQVPEPQQKSGHLPQLRRK